MFAKLFIFTFLAFSNAYLTDNIELRRQYEDYRKIFKKTEPVNGLENFVKNLNIIEEYNRNYGDCKLYLTRYSDTESESEIEPTVLKKCRKIRNIF